MPATIGGTAGNEYVMHGHRRNMYISWKCIHIFTVTCSSLFEGWPCMCMPLCPQGEPHSSSSSRNPFSVDIWAIRLASSSDADPQSFPFPTRADRMTRAIWMPLLCVQVGVVCVVGVAWKCNPLNGASGTGTDGNKSYEQYALYLQSIQANKWTKKKKKRRRRQHTTHNTQCWPVNAVIFLHATRQ